MPESGLTNPLSLDQAWPFTAGGTIGPLHLLVLQFETVQSARNSLLVLTAIDQVPERFGADDALLDLCVSWIAEAAGDAEEDELLAHLSEIPIDRWRSAGLVPVQFDAKWQNDRSEEVEVIAHPGHRASLLRDPAVLFGESFRKCEFAGHLEVSSTCDLNDHDLFRSAALLLRGHTDDEASDDLAHDVVWATPERWSLDFQSEDEWEEAENRYSDANADSEFRSEFAMGSADMVPFDSFGSGPEPAPPRLRTCGLVERLRNPDAGLAGRTSTVGLAVCAPVWHWLDLLDLKQQVGSIEPPASPPSPPVPGPAVIDPLVDE